MVQPSELLIVKHAEAQCDVTGVVGGPNGDTGLTKAGRIQAVCAAARLVLESAPQPFSAVYSGSRPRVLQTAAIIADVVGAPLRRLATLADQRYGTAIDGQPWRAVYEAFGGSPAHEPHRAMSEGGESWNAYVSRVGRALGRLTSRHPGERIVVVGGNGTVDASLMVFLSLPEGGTHQVGVDCLPTGLTRWREVPAERHAPALGLRWTLVEHNAAEHLPKAARMLEAAA